MTDYYSDFEELRPLGEANHVPDDRLSERENAEQGERLRRERLESYPDRVRSARSECSSCGASITANRTKYRFCLTNHLDGTSDESPTPDTGWILLHIVHLLVEASTFYTAVAKGAAAATLLTEMQGGSPRLQSCLLPISPRRSKQAFQPLSNSSCDRILEVRSDSSDDASGWGG